MHVLTRPPSHSLSWLLCGASYQTLLDITASYTALLYLINVYFTVPLPYLYWSLWVVLFFQAPVLNIDLAPTILDISGLNLSYVNMDGQSFLSQMVSCLLKPVSSFHLISFSPSWVTPPPFHLPPTFRPRHYAMALLAPTFWLSIQERATPPQTLLAPNWALAYLWVTSANSWHSR